MDTIGQKQAVVNAVETVLGDSFTSTVTKVKEILTSEQLSEIRSIVLDGILNGHVVYSKPTTDADAARRYVNGMVDNHLRKSKELNGGDTYKPTKSGAKRDTALLNLNRLLTTYTEGTEEYVEVQDAITSRQRELKTIKSHKKVNKNAVNTDIIPAELASLIE